jgi:hypothetical protein
MWNRIKNINFNIPKIVGIILMAVGFFILIITATIVKLVNFTDITLSMISIYVSASLGLISIGIAIISIGLSQESDEKMIAIKKIYFSEILDTINDYIDWCGKNIDASKTVYQEKNNILKWLIIAGKAEILKKWFEECETKSFSIGFTALLKNWVSQWEKGLLTEIERQQIYDIFEFCKNENLLTVGDTIVVNKLLEELKKEKSKEKHE